MVAERRRVTIRGRVQRVYFRETVRRIAASYAVGGFVRNVSVDLVEIEAEGEPAVVDAFIRQVLAQPPPRARIEAVRTDATTRRGAARLCRGPETSAATILRVAAPPLSSRA